MAWTTRYLARLGDLEQEPSYAVLIFRDRTSLNADVTITGTSFVGDSGESMTLPPPRFGTEQFVIYDSEGFEFVTGIYDSATNTLSSAGRGQFGTAAKAFAKGAAMASVWLAFSTQPVTGTTFPFTANTMGFPSGAEAEFNLIEGTTRSGLCSFSVEDEQGEITRSMKSTTIIGKTSMVLGGYEGLRFMDYVPLHVGPVTRFQIRQASVYEIEIDNIMVKLKRRLFRDVEAFDTTLSTSMNSSTTTIPLTDSTGAYTGSVPTFLRPDPATGGSAATDYRAAMYFKVDDEIMRHGGGTSVERGMFGTTAASHSSGATVDMAFIVEGNPIDILFGFLITRDPGLDPLVSDAPYTGFFYNDWWETVDPDKAPLGMNFDLGDIDVDSFIDCRDGGFKDYFGRFAFTKQTDMESYIPDVILKPMGLALYPTQTGKLGLFILRPPLLETSDAIGEGEIVGVPEPDFNNEEIVNEVEVNYDFDLFGSDSSSQTVVLDATSQSRYDRVGNVILDVQWMQSSMNGDSLSARLAKKKMRHHRDPNPVISLDVLYTAARVELGSVIRLNHSTLPDPQRGEIGWSRLVLVVGRKPNWQQGALTLDVIDTAYLGRRWGLIAPSGMVDYAPASQDTKDTYVFLGPLSDGSQNYQVA